jgi:hypothetical protein
LDRTVSWLQESLPHINGASTALTGTAAREHGVMDAARSRVGQLGGDSSSGPTILGARSSGQGRSMVAGTSITGTSAPRMIWSATLPMTSAVICTADTSE